jgi:hypothetical protein
VCASSYRMSIGKSDKTLRLWIDDAEQVNRVHHWLPITTCIARLLLKNEFPRIYLTGLADDGTDSTALNTEGVAL